jgi:hypothetical protein
VKALKLDRASGVDALANHGGELAGMFARQFLIAKGRYFDFNVDAVEQWAGYMWLSIAILPSDLPSVFGKPPTTRLHNLVFQQSVETPRRCSSWIAQAIGEIDNRPPGGRVLRPALRLLHCTKNFYRVRYRIT